MTNRARKLITEMDELATKSLPPELFEMWSQIKLHYALVDTESVKCDHSAEECPDDCEHRLPHSPLDVTVDAQCHEIEDQCFLIGGKPICQCK